MHRLSQGIPRLINQICDISLTYGFAEQTGFITRKLVAQAALDRSRGGILPLGRIEELGALAASADDPDEIPVPLPLPQLNVPSFDVDAPAPESGVNPSDVSPDIVCSQGVALRKEGHFTEVIEAFDRVSDAPSYGLKASAQAGLCDTEDTAARIKRLTLPPKPLESWTRSAGVNDSWFSHVLDSLLQLIGSRR